MSCLSEDHHFEAIQLLQPQPLNGQLVYVDDHIFCIKCGQVKPLKPVLD